MTQQVYQVLAPPGANKYVTASGQELPLELCSLAGVRTPSPDANILR
jgi:hypothetical protein